MSDNGKQPKENPLDVLFVSQELDLQLLAETLIPYVQLTPDGDFRPTAKWKDLNLQGKILTYMLARKALLEKGVVNDERVTASLIEEATSLKGGSIRPTLAKLLDASLVKVDSERNYHIPDYTLPEVSKVLKG